MPFGMAATMTRFARTAEAYSILYSERRQIRDLYMLLLLMMTSLALFASCWLALHLSKQVTKPVEALADAMEAIASGDYAHRVQESATEELGELVRSFNHMASDLEDSRRAVEHSTVQLSAANTALEARRGELETMLETIPNGVATLDADRRIVLANRALSEMMDPGGQRPFYGRVMEDVFPPEVVDVLDRLIKRSHRMGSASSEIEITAPIHASNDRFGGTMNLLATVALLEIPGATERLRREHQGYVLVLENATELLRAQKQSAWKEVARRVAHEIKNPLTPISLSAEQIRRHIDRLAHAIAGPESLAPENHVPEPASIAVIRRCCEVITSSVESMRSLVDQFAALAEFPTAQPKPADLNTIVENSLALFAGRMQTIRIVRKMAPDLPLVMADPEALKRALGNLIDNAAEAMQQSLFRELRIRYLFWKTAWLNCPSPTQVPASPTRCANASSCLTSPRNSEAPALVSPLLRRSSRSIKAPFARKRTNPPAPGSSSNSVPRSHSTVNADALLPIGSFAATRNGNYRERNLSTEQVHENTGTSLLRRQRVLWPPSLSEEQNEPRTYRRR